MGPRGRVYSEPALWGEGAVSSIRRVLQETRIAPGEIAGIGLTGQMHGLVLLDEAGRVLRPALLWNDQRTGRQCDQIRERLGKERLIQITGNDALTGFTAPKILWVKDHEPEYFERTRHILLPKDYLRYRLTGGYGLVVSTGAQRATQTAGSMLAGLGETVPRGVVVVPGLRSDREDEWRDAYAEGGAGDLGTFLEVAPDLVDEQAETLGAALRSVLERLDDGERALVIGHSPTNEAAVLGLTGETVDPFGKGEGVEIVVDGDRYEVRRLT